MNFNKLFVFFFVLLLSLQVTAFIQENSVDVYAVTDSGDALTGRLTLKISPGTGKLSFEVNPLVGTSTQTSMKNAVKIAGNYAKDSNKYNYEFIIDAKASLVDGPSAGSAMTLLVISSLQEKKVPNEVGLTGTITTDGLVGPVGGVYKKAEKASKDGKKLFLIPEGEEKQVVRINDSIQSVNLPQYALQNWGLKVIAVSSMDDVLKYAFSDINSLEVSSTSSNETTDFIPQPAVLTEEITPLKSITQKYISESKKLIESAKKSVETTILEDDSLVDILLIRLNESETALGRAELLFEKNYFYSAANSAFVSQIEIELVKDIAENPSLLSNSSTAFDVKLQKLEDDVKAFKKQLSGKLSIGKNLEWFAAAQQRLSYAETTIEELKLTQTIVVPGIEGELPSTQKYAIPIERLRKYEFAKAWLNVSKDLHGISSSSNTFVDQKELFVDSTNKFIVESENGLTILKSKSISVEDMERRLNGAKKNLQNKWFVASLFDGASALGLINAELTLNKLEEKNELREFFDVLRTKISSLDKNMSSSKYSFGWPKLYLDHAKFFLSSAEDSYSKNRAVATKQFLRNGISLVFLAENLFIVSEEVYAYYDKIDPSIISSSNGVVSSNSDDNFGNFPGNVSRNNSDTEIKIDFNSTWFLLGLFVLLVLVFSVILIVGLNFVGLISFNGQKKDDLVSEIKHQQKLQKQLDLEFALHKINEEQYKYLKKDFASKLSDLEARRKIKAAQLIGLDKIRAQYFATIHLLRDLKNHYTLGLIDEEQYNKEFQKYSLQKNKLKESLSTQKKISSKKKLKN